MSQPMDTERRQYPRFPCDAPIRVSVTDIFDNGITGECLEVCRNGLRIRTLQRIPAPAEVSLRALTLGLEGHAIVRYCHDDHGRYIVGLEFVAGLHWQAPDPMHSENELSRGMTPRTAAIFQDLLGGIPARDLQPAVDNLSDRERDILFCTAACIQSAVAETCRQRAAEIEGMLHANSQRLPANLTPV